MIKKDNTVHSDECKCLAWQPIIAGALVAVGLSFLLNLFSISIGLTAITTNNVGIESLAIGGMIGMGIGILSSMFAAGYLTGYLSKRHCCQRHLGALYGLLAWTIALIVSVLIFTQVQQYILFYNHVIHGTTDIMQIIANLRVSNVTNTANISTHHFIATSYVVFALFFLSAFSCAFGGYCGARHEI